MERLRDTAHVRALTLDEWTNLFAEGTLMPNHVEFFRFGGDLDSLLARAFPREGDDLRIRQLFEEALADDFLDVQPRREDGKIVYGFPIAILKARKSAH